MSTILKALEKAQRERAGQQEADSATVLDLPLPTPESQRVVVGRRSRVGLVMASVIVSTLVTLVVLGGVLWFLQARLQEWAGSVTPPPRLPNTQTLPGTALAVGAAGAPAQAGAANAPFPAANLPNQPVAPNPSATIVNPTHSAAADLPTPVPMSELYRETNSASPASVHPAPSLAATVTPQVDPRSSFVLGPILYDPRSPMAIVNGMSVREGGVYENFRVLKITPDSVTVQRAGEQPMTLRKNRGF